MSTVNTDAIKPRDTGLDITLGATGDTTVISANSINTNTIKDSGGNTLWTSDGSGTLSSVNAGLKGNLILLATNTFTDVASSSFTTLIDSTYDVYKFVFNAINPENDNDNLQIQFSTDGGLSYGVTTTSTYFLAKHYEDDTTASLAYVTDEDAAQSTGMINLASGIGSGSDECAAGELYLFSPASTTYVKNFYSVFNFYKQINASFNSYVGGYVNTTSAVNAVIFKMDNGTGNLDGEIKMYGLL